MNTLKVEETISINLSPYNPAGAITAVGEGGQVSK